jgi:hypothetical protein
MGENKFFFIFIIAIVPLQRLPVLIGVFFIACRMTCAIHMIPNNPVLTLAEKLSYRECACV